VDANSLIFLYMSISVHMKVDANSPNIFFLFFYLTISVHFLLMDANSANLFYFLIFLYMSISVHYSGR
jgi:hypothetical protein